MKTIKAFLLAFCLSAVPFPIFASTPSPDYTVTHSTQTFVLTNNTPLYDKWKAWMDQQNVDRRKLGPVNGPGLPYEVGRITITVTSGMVGATLFPGPPMPLPTNGTEGQTLTMVNQTAAVYQQWIYGWEDRGGGWREFTYSGYACKRPREGGEVCEP